MGFTFSEEPCESPRTLPRRTRAGKETWTARDAGWGLASRAAAEVSREPGGLLAAPERARAPRVPLNRRFGGLACASRGRQPSGLGAGPRPPGRRAYGVSKVTLRAPTSSGGGENTYEPSGDPPRRAPGERPPLLPVRPGASGPQTSGTTCIWAELAWFVRNGFCLKF